MSRTSADYQEFCDAAIKSLQELVSGTEGPSDPLSEFSAIQGYTTLYESLAEIRNSVMAISAGDLKYPIHMKGYVSGAIKSMQASLRHLTWQTKAIASGDYTQRVDFMGEFSEAFNAMVLQLDETMRNLRLSEQNLKHMARTDPLTGTNNRGYFLELLRAEIDRCRRYSHTFSVLMLDVDYFKSVNDTHGHAAGDEALRTIIGVFQSCGLRQSDFWGRLGGEEFAIALPETELQAAAEAAERLRANLAKTPVLFENLNFFISISIGVSQFRPDDDLESLLRRSDKAMYEAKQTGRNRVCLAQ
ncbi:MAG: GGDEF domain-containing protein [Treponemataceae bacterium]